MSTTRPSPRRQESGSARPLLVLLLAVAMFAAGAATSWWWLTQPPAKPVAVATPPPDFGPLTPSPVSSPEAIPSGSAPPSTQVAEAAPAPPSSTLPATRTGGAASRGSGRAAAAPPVILPPGGKTLPLPGRGTRSFVLGTTVVESLRPTGHDLDGFDTAGVGVKRAPKVEGTIELVMEPAQVKAGEPYAVKVFLRNEGRKPIDVGDMKVSMIVDGKSSTRPMPAKARQIAPQQRALLEELPGVWRADVADWAVEAVVTSKQHDVYRNRLTWK